MKGVRGFFQSQWQTIASMLAISIVVCGLLGYRLATLTPGWSKQEVAFVESSATFAQLQDNPLYLPLKLPLFILQSFDQATILHTRLVSAAFGFAIILMFYYVIKQQATRRVALLASFLFIISSWFLQSSRVALPIILFAFASMFIMALEYLLRHRPKSKLAFSVAALGIVSLLYIPTVIWMVLALFIWQAKRIIRAINTQPMWLKISLTVVAGLILTPLVMAFVNDPQLLKTWAGVPEALEPVEWLRRALLLPVFLIAQGPLEPTFNLGRLPLLDVFVVLLVVIGCYIYYLELATERVRLMSIMVIVACLITAISGIPYILYLMPLIYIAAAAGLTLLLQQWFTVFPRNPVARGLGVLVISVAISMTAFYHLQRYFVAWSGNPTTRTLFVQRP